MFAVTHLAGFAAGQAIPDMASVSTMGLSTAGGRGITSSQGHGGFQFTVPGSGPQYIRTVQLELNQGHAGKNFFAEIYSNSGSSPGTQNGADSPLVDVSAAGTKTFTFASPILVQGGDTVWAIINNNGETSTSVVVVTKSGGPNKSDRNATVTSMTPNGWAVGEDWSIKIN